MVLGLDWIDRRGWAYCQLGMEADSRPRLGILPPEDIATSSLVAQSASIVVDAPIGLRAHKQEGGGDRPCDRGARLWLGKRKFAVIAPPVEAELREWRSRRDSGGRQRQGHVRGLLPAISSAEELRCAHPRTLESHPELVFAALAGGSLPPEGKKTQLLGMLARASLLQGQGIELDLRDLVGSVPADNYLDAIAMALVACAWQRLEADLPVIRAATGIPGRLGEDPSRECLMALPGAASKTFREPPLPALDFDDLVALAAQFRPVPAEKRA